MKEGFSDLYQYKTYIISLFYYSRLPPAFAQTFYHAGLDGGFSEFGHGLGDFYVGELSVCDYYSHTFSILSLSAKRLLISFSCLNLSSVLELVNIE